MLEKYGVENGLQLEKTRNLRRTEKSKLKQKETTKQSNLVKYGVKNVFQLEHIKEKSKKD